MVCTELPEARAEEFAGVTLAGTAEEFIAACKRAADGADEAAIKRGRQEWAKRSWRKAAREMEAAVDDVLAKG